MGGRNDHENLGSNIIDAVSTTDTDARRALWSAVALVGVDVRTAEGGGVVLEQAAGVKNVILGVFEWISEALKCLYAL